MGGIILAKYNLNQTPYNDDYDPSKRYLQLLAIPGRVAQAREFTQAQSLTRDIIKSVGDAFMKDGDVIEGCQVTVSTDKTTATVSAGKVYIDGAVLPVPESVVEITGEGIESIGVIIVDEIVDELIDPTLRDPALNYENYNLPGCHRLKRTLKVVVDDPTAAILSTLNDGDLMLETYSPEYDTLTQTLARRTFDESGSYIVRGLNVHTEDNVDSAYYTVVVDIGKAYVLGYELGIASTRRIPVLRSTTYDLVTVSSMIYLIADTNYQLDDDLYVKDIVVVGNRYRTEAQSITTGTDRVLLSEIDVVSIEEVNVGTTIYTKGTDYRLVRDGSRHYIEWLGQSFPAPGVQYQIKYVYKHTFTNGVDYSLVAIDGGHYLHWNTDNNDAKVPINNTGFVVQYNQYLARKDMVYIDQYGTIGVKQGVPAEFGFEEAPEAPMDTLPLAVIVSPPNGSVGASDSRRINTTNVGLVRFTMQDIQEMLNRIRTLEFDQAVLALENDAEQDYDENEKKGILTDPFVDLTRCDLTYNLNTSGEIVDATQPIFAMAIDVEMNLAYLPVNEKMYDLEYNPATTTCQVIGRLAMLGKTGEICVLEQPVATTSFLVNPYSVYPGTPIISINPAVDVWIEESIIEVPVSLTKKTVVKTTTKTIRSSRRIHKVFKKYTTTSTKTKTSEIGTQVDTYTTDNVISEEEITYIRPREIEVSGENFPINLDNIYGYIDGVQVSLTPKGTTAAGTNIGTVKSDSKGSFSCTFNIPEGIKTGEREVRMQSSIEIDGWLNFASTVYQAYGTSRTIERTVTTVTTVLLKRTVTKYKTTYVDPVGQSFYLPEKSLVSAVDLYFEAKADSAAITCEIRGVTNGIINDDIYAQCIKRAEDVNISPNATVATRFTFDDNPVVIDADTQYAIVLRSESDDYRVWIAEMGKDDILTGETVMKNPYLSGVFYSSSNNSAWTIHQMYDLKFRLYKYTYATEGVLNFLPISVESSPMITLTGDSLIPVGTNLFWSYSTDGSNYKEVTIGELINLGRESSQVYARVNMTRSESTDLTPILALDTCGILAGKYDLEGNYIFKNVTNLDPFDIVKIVVETYLPANTTLEFYASVNDGQTWDLMTEDTNATIKRNYDWYERTYKFTYPTANKTQMRVRVHATSTNSWTTPAIRRFRAIMSEVVH